MLGEVEDALQYFNKCLESGSGVCLDRQILIEAANGLQKAQVPHLVFNIAIYLLFVNHYILIVNFENLLFIKAKWERNRRMGDWKKFLSFLLKYVIQACAGAYNCPMNIFLISF